MQDNAKIEKIGGCKPGLIIYIETHRFVITHKVAYKYKTRKKIVSSIIYSLKITVNFIEKPNA